MTGPERLAAAEYAESIGTDGFVVVPDVVDPATVLKLRSAVERALQLELDEFEGRPGKIPHLAVELLHRDIVFAELLENQFILDMFEAVLGPECIIYCLNSAIMPPQQRTSACEIHVDQTFHIPGYCARMLMTLALDDFTEDSGATYHMPRSQRLPEPPSEEEFYATAIRTTRKAGDAVFFDCRNWHAGAVNHGEEVRYGIGLQAARPFLKQRFDYPSWDLGDLPDQLSERARRFLGLQSQPPSRLDDYYRPPSERTFRPVAR